MCNNFECTGCMYGGVSCAVGGQAELSYCGCTMLGHFLEAWNDVHIWKVTVWVSWECVSQTKGCARGWGHYWHGELPEVVRWWGGEQRMSWRCLGSQVCTLPKASGISFCKNLQRRRSWGEAEMDRWGRLETHFPLLERSLDSCTLFSWKECTVWRGKAF